MTRPAHIAIDETELLITCPECGTVVVPPEICPGCGLGIPEGVEPDYYRYRTVEQDDLLMQHREEEEE